MLGAGGLSRQQDLPAFGVHPSRENGESAGASTAGHDKESERRRGHSVGASAPRKGRAHEPVAAIRSALSDVHSGLVLGSVAASEHRKPTVPPAVSHMVLT